MPSTKKYEYHRPRATDNSAQNDTDVRKNNCCEDCCGLACLKFALNLFTFLCFITGVILLAVGLWTILEKHPSLEALLTSGLYDVTGYVLVAAGSVILVSTVIGCCGVNKKSRNSLVLIYAVLLGFVFIVEASAGLLAYIYREQVSAELSANLNDKFMKEYSVDNETTLAIDQLQITLSCCGVDSFEDWKNSEWWASASRRNNKVPDSCCISPSKYCGVRDHPSNIRYTGCTDRLNRIAGDHLIIVGAVALGICLLQIVGTLLACFLHCKLKETRFG